jgi:predicted enzyme related to lactoylglutathione lyase
MSSPMLGLRTVVYSVNDLAKAKDWYTHAFRTAPYFDEPFYVGFSIGGYELGLVPEEQNNATKGTNIITYWGVDDVDREYQRLLAAGGLTHEAPHNVGGEIVVASVLDPWGNLFGLIFNPHFQLT